MSKLDPASFRCLIKMITSSVSDQPTRCNTLQQQHPTNLLYLSAVSTSLLTKNKEFYSRSLCISPSVRPSTKTVTQGALMHTTETINNYSKHVKSFAFRVYQEVNKRTQIQYLVQGKHYTDGLLIYGRTAKS
jgi:hypothetical protein